MANEITTIDISGFALDNEYTFYDDGRIKHFYDRNPHRLNITEWIEAKDISDDKKAKLLEKCEPEFKDRIQSILFPRVEE
jgi:hypothetical protein